MEEIRKLSLNSSTFPKYILLYSFIAGESPSRNDARFGILQPRNSSRNRAYFFELLRMLVSRLADKISRSLEQKMADCRWRSNCMYYTWNIASKALTARPTDEQACSTFSRTCRCCPRSTSRSRSFDRRSATARRSGSRASGKSGRRSTARPDGSVSAKIYAKRARV